MQFFEDKTKELVELSNFNLSEEERIKKMNVSEFYSLIVARHQINEQRKKEMEKHIEKSKSKNKK